MKKTSKLRVTGGNSGEFPAQMSSNAKMFPFDDVIMINIYLTRWRFVQIYLWNMILLHLLLLSVNRHTERFGRHSPSHQQLINLLANIIRYRVIFMKKIRVCLCFVVVLHGSISSIHFRITPLQLGHIPWYIMTSSNGDIFRVTGPLCREFTGHRWIPRTKASEAELWCFIWSAPEQTVE